MVAGPPRDEPIGLQVNRTAKALSRAFDAALAEAGGSLPMWLVLVSLKAQRHGMQRELAEAVGIEGPTLTHHLNRMEAAGLVTRRRDPDNRRVHRVELTSDGEALFDRPARAGFDDSEIAALKGMLDRLGANVGGAAGRQASPRGV